jgi:IS30 family transposase
MARALGRAPSTVNREIRRNGGWLAHRANEADASAWQRARRPKRCKPGHKLPRELYKSLTWDRGKAMADHQGFSLATDVKVYFCDPQQPWQRGSNENTMEVSEPTGVSHFLPFFKTD